MVPDSVRVVASGQTGPSDSRNGHDWFHERSGHYYFHGPAARVQDVSGCRVFCRLYSGPETVADLSERAVGADGDVGSGRTVHGHYEVVSESAENW
mmetsp:Transcript_30027/g.44395  ORF Transcript_30027/g.44395 Transcript_30027/m.44395 type:complete len:96 (+) Transcript_30027:842-1129(+)